MLRYINVMMDQFLYLFLLLIGLRAMASSPCRRVSFAVDAAAQNVRFDDSPDPGNQTAILSFVSTAIASLGAASTGTAAAVSGTFQVDGTYCVPTANHGRNALQILV